MTSVSVLDASSEVSYSTGCGLIVMTYSLGLLVLPAASPKPIDVGAVGWSPFKQPVSLCG
jgi:hypothetical protein